MGFSKLSKPAGETRGWVPQYFPARLARAAGYRLDGVNPPQNLGGRSAEGISWPAVPTATRLDLTSGGEKSIIKRGGAPHSEKRGTHL